MTAGPRKSRGTLSSLTSLRLAMIAMIMALPFLLPSLSVVQHVDNELTAFRAAGAPRPATGDFVFVAIDKKSLADIGTWPWPREVHAELIDRLVAAGARDIFLDIDFSTPSRPESDARLARALEDAGGGVILPMFRQQFGARSEDPLTLTAPIPLFADNAWTALVDVSLDEDGLMRSFPVTDMVDGVPTQSAPAVLAGYSDARTQRLAIDFSIRPETVPTYSVSDVLSGSVAGDALSGKSVVVGAYATELKDLFAVPVYGILSGPMLHVLATETLVQDRLLKPLQIEPIVLLLAALIITYMLTFSRVSFGVPLAASAAMVAIGEAAAFLLYKNEAIVFHTATLWAVLAFGLLMLMAEKIGIKGWLAELAIRENRDIRRVLKRVINDSVDPVIVLDQKFNLLDASHTTTDLLGLYEPVARGTNLSGFVPAVLMETVLALEAKHVAEPDKAHSEPLSFSMPGRSGRRHLKAVITISPFESGGGQGLSSVGTYVTCISLRDVTARRLYETKLEEMSRVDDLTGLLTRRGLVDAMAKVGTGFSVFVIDLHRFSHLNETLGREKGDGVLKAVAARLRRHAGIDGLSARLAGDTLCLATPGVEDEAGLSESAERLLALFDTPFGVDGIKIELNARVGACSGSLDLGDPGQWIGAAELALIEAKRVGGSGWRAYDPSSALRRARSRLLEAEMRGALEQGHFFLLYQPQVALKSGQLVGAEALLRWQHPTLGMISPAEFIGIAETNGFICDLGQFMFKDACKAATSWPSHVSVAVNISPVQFLRGDLLADLRAALAVSGLAPHRLHVEITESMFLEKSEELFEKLNALRDLGVTIALDDFGTGYSSLSYISSLPLDKLKIDQSFIRDMVSDPAAQTIVQSITTLAHGLGLTLVCEGVENALQCEMLTALRCEEGQGYFFGRPQPARQILALSAAHSLLSGGDAISAGGLAQAG
ncbi:EAL domain-containing protein [Rhizobium rosettiformans]|uniref:EAL domain-containing protein n=1 Tax=Rhizobium rosettiformans TaxID=1368430 RepID=UPI0028665CCA|nr:EAL domain-containing protein [Rhizobium rosettiformans]MDR7028664.1 diguanylate cyclase (GGDEF)-like protein [Rhizobium rosettiformans]MDR7064054.1 diguanylate cyclase (GGDEF)-like protein [Rhizobium rosettiformans]